MPLKRPYYFILGCEGGRQRFRLNPDGSTPADNPFAIGTVQDISHLEDGTPEQNPDWKRMTPFRLAIFHYHHD